jgi:hypothetical protein
MSALLQYLAFALFHSSVQLFSENFRSDVQADAWWIDADVLLDGVGRLLGMHECIVDFVKTLKYDISKNSI